MCPAFIHNCILDLKIPALPIGITGYHGVGKSTFAKYLDAVITEYRFSVKTIECSSLIYQIFNKHFPNAKIDKNKPFHRAVLEFIGMYKRNEDPQYMYNWICSKICEKQSARSPIDALIIVGLRHLADVRAVLDSGGYIIYIERPNHKAKLLPTESEVSQLHYDYKVINDGNLQELRKQAEAIYNFRYS